MNLTYRTLSDRDKQTICAWHYPDEYAVYDLPSYEEMKRRKMAFLNPARERNFYGFLDGENLVGFVNIAEEETEVLIGIGVAPDLCGRGYGQAILREAYRISKEKYREKPLYLKVQTCNRRAVRCYERVGFRADGEPFEQQTHIGTGLFQRMIKE